MPGAIEFSLSWDFVVRFFSITLIDLALSGDNAIVIGMAAASLPRRQRQWAILGGSGVAILLRIILTAIATLLMTIPFISVLGGLVLFWVVWKLLRIDTGEAHGGGATKARDTSNLRQAIILIITADFMMSLDNVLAVAGSAHGNILLIIIGLVISMPLLMTTGGVISMLIDKFKWIIYVGAVVISFTSTRMILEDKVIAARLELHGGIIIAIAVITGILVPLLFTWINKRRAKAARLKAASETQTNAEANSTNIKQVK